MVKAPSRRAGADLGCEWKDGDRQYQPTYPKFFEGFEGEHLLRKTLENGSKVVGVSTHQSIQT